MSPTSSSYASISTHNAGDGPKEPVRNALPVTRVRWHPCWRIIPTRLPRVNVFARIAPAQHFKQLDAIEALTNERARLQKSSKGAAAGVRGAVNAEILLAPFAYPNPAGSRFSDGSYGVLYCARTIRTAIAETRYHRELFLRATGEPEMFLPMSAYRLDAQGSFHDIRGLQRRLPEVYSASSYAHSQPFAKALYAADAAGIAYDSVRLDGGQCIAGFSPAPFSNSRLSQDLLYLWNGRRISDVLFLSSSPK